MAMSRSLPVFLAWLLPGEALASLLARLAADSAPALAFVALLSLAFLAFALAVSAAARAALGAERGTVIAVLCLRRNRARQALGFALAGVAAGTAAVLAAGPAVLVAMRPGHAVLAFALAFVAAWLILGEAVCSQAAIRRALLREVERG